MRGTWGRLAGGRRAHAGAIRFELLEDRLQLSHTALTLAASALTDPVPFDRALVGPAVAPWSEAASIPQMQQFGDAPTVTFDLANRWQPAPQAMVVETGPAGFVVAQPGLIVPPPSSDPAKLVAVGGGPLGVQAGEANQRFWSIAVGAISAMHFDAARFEFGAAAVAGVFAARDGFEVRATQLHGMPREQWAGHDPTIEPSDEAAAMVFFRPERSTHELESPAPAALPPPVWMHTAAATPAVSMPEVPANADPGSLAQQPSLAVEDEALVELAAGDEAPPVKDASHAPAESADAAPARAFLAQAFAAAASFLADLRQIDLPGFAPAIVDTLLIDSVGFDAAELERALDDILVEIEGLGNELISWVDELRWSPWTVLVVAAAATGVVGAAARRRDRRVGDESREEDSSSWLFARFQDPHRS